MVAKQGAVQVLEQALYKTSGLSTVPIREKGMYILAWLARIPEVRSMLSTTRILDALIRELTEGTPTSKYTIVQIVLNLRKTYPTREPRFYELIRPLLLDVMTHGMWHARNMCVKALVLLYSEHEHMKWFCDHGALENILDLLTCKTPDLYEVPMVALLALFTHPDIPYIFIEKGGPAVVGSLLNTNNANLIVRDMAIILLAALQLYDPAVVEAAIPKGRGFLMD